jgi:hypothetical protein
MSAGGRLGAPVYGSELARPISSGGSSGGAPTDAQYWVGAADATLSAEKNLGVLSTGLVKNTAGVPSIAVAGTDYLANDVIERQTLGADAQTVTFTVDGNSDESVELEGFGECNASGTVTIELNNTATYRSMVDGASALYTFVTTFTIATVADDALQFRYTFNLRATGTADRGGFGIATIGYGTSEIYIGSFWIANTADNITSIKLVGSVANVFGTGFKFITRRRKMSA